MQPTRLFTVAAGIALALAASPAAIWASQSSPGGVRVASRQSPPATRANPYGGLFKTPDLAKSQSPDPAPKAEAGQPRVVCGMTVIPADPSIDPKIAITPSHGDTRYTIRAIEPPICK